MTLVGLFKCNINRDRHVAACLDFVNYGSPLVGYRADSSFKTYAGIFVNCQNDGVTLVSAGVTVKVLTPTLLILPLIFLILDGLMIGNCSASVLFGIVRTVIPSLTAISLRWK